MPETPDTLVRTIGSQKEHRIFFTRHAFHAANAALEEALTSQDPGVVPRVLVFWDAGLGEVFPELPKTIERWFASRSGRLTLAAAPVALPGGEAAKSGLHELERVWQAIEAAGLCRHSYVLAIGGGSVLDVVGFAAGTAHRGIPLVRMPTTSLSQGDAGVGVKNGVNFFKKKNWLGTFYVPHAVVNDAAFLHVLPPAERRAGLIEAVKVSLIRDPKFFEAIACQVPALAAFEPGPFEAVIRESALQHVEHIATSGDPFERGSARPLDFGHWSAHKLEQMSSFRVRHGDAVAVGMALDLIYARLSGLMSASVCDRILGVISGLGFPLYRTELGQKSESGRPVLLDGLEEFREHLGGRLTIPMVRSPGERIDVHEMDSARVEEALQELKQRYGR